ncbi:MAG TPA: SDR family oxidoreductase [Candidatus Korarchaeota archaeon]|nr:SDR family oxidoreductase [Candidatus Korarchaeota archaeon]
MSLKDKVAIITGAGSGIGRATALLFAEEGANVVICDIAEEGAKVCEEIMEKGGEATFIKADVSKAKDVINLIRKTVDKYGRVDILVNNAGIPSHGTVLDISEAEWDRVLNVNLKGAFLCSKYAVPEMIKGGGGVIVNVASVIGLIGGKGEAAYCASKGGLIALTKALALDFAEHKIRVNCVCPGSVETPMREMIMAQKTPEERKAAELKIPIKRVARPEEIARVILFLASEGSSYMTGSVLVVDGGWTAQ